MGTRSTVRWSESRCLVVKSSLSAADAVRRSMLPKADQPIQLTKQQAEEVEANRRAADQRSRFEQVLFRLKNLCDGAEDRSAGMLHQLRVGRSRAGALGGAEPGDGFAEGRYHCGAGSMGERAHRCKRAEIRGACRKDRPSHRRGHAALPEESMTIMSRCGASSSQQRATSSANG